MTDLFLQAATYDGGLFPCMEDFLAHLKSKTYRNRTVAIIENGSWGPMAAKHIRAALSARIHIPAAQYLRQADRSGKIADILRMR